MPTPPAALLNSVEFNQDEFNESPFNYWILYLNPDTDATIVGFGTSLAVPSDKLFPGNSYLYRRVANGATFNMRFDTPPAIQFDGLGG